MFQQLSVTSHAELDQLQMSAGIRSPKYNGAAASTGWFAVNPRQIACIGQPRWLSANRLRDLPVGALAARIVLAPGRTEGRN